MLPRQARRTYNNLTKPTVPKRGKSGFVQGNQGTSTLVKGKAILDEQVRI